MDDSNPNIGGFMDNFPQIIWNMSSFSRIIIGIMEMSH